jgi:hypothetical protein
MKPIIFSFNSLEAFVGWDVVSDILIAGDKKSTRKGECLYQQTLWVLGRAANKALCTSVKVHNDTHKDGPEHGCDDVDCVPVVFLKRHGHSAGFRGEDEKKKVRRLRL